MGSSSLLLSFQASYMFQNLCISFSAQLSKPLFFESAVLQSLRPGSGGKAIISGTEESIEESYVFLSIRLPCSVGHAIRGHHQWREGLFGSRHEAASGQLPRWRLGTRSSDRQNHFINQPEFIIDRHRLLVQPSLAAVSTDAVHPGTQISSVTKRSQQLFC